MTRTPPPDAGPGPTPAGSRSWRRGLGLALVVALVQTAGTALAARGQSADLDLPGCALLATSGLALAGRHHFPRAATVAVVAATVAYHVPHHPAGPTFVALVLAGLFALRAGRHRLFWATGAVSYTGWVVLSGAAPGPAVALAAWVCGGGLFVELFLGAARVMARMARDQRRLHRERQLRHASEERLRIAHELHDVLGHHLSLINMRAGVGLHLMGRQPDQAVAALEAIRQASAEALREVQSVISTLYPTGATVPPRAPAPGLDQLDDLTVDAGLPVRAMVTGGARELPAEVSRAAYRLVQEALTNVRRHAGPGATAAVLVDQPREDLVVVQVEDDGGARGPLTAPVAEGNGIGGMRERATALGGTLTAGPLSAGGWRVRAELPLPTAGGSARADGSAVGSGGAE
ncbi:two-component sensor histidine kinase [Longispora fulva]|uniref:histidine kinase n=1 Tax=Longispora fulva TaxID=619741 RepID=A0A8J7G876_9ACTN|nr:histidine kinase [Longispora fulva]MBG6134740.1 signal transduction histidine kinase [Longispora fulva]GIG61951.1 two-component sensor histidine kinase [Longispora fulva]